MKSNGSVVAPGSGYTKKNEPDMEAKALHNGHNWAILGLINSHIVVIEGKVNLHMYYKGYWYMKWNQCAKFNFWPSLLYSPHTNVLRKRHGSLSSCLSYRLNSTVDYDL